MNSFSSPKRTLVRPMLRRDSLQSHRPSTPLELLFDLVSVIAIAAAAAGLHHAVAESHALVGVIKFSCAFFGIWWAWMNYTWFASAYDNDDTLFRLLTMVIMSGALAMAAGISVFFETLSLKLVVIGYVIMRLAMVVLWLRAAKDDLTGRDTALWYAGGIALAQLFWIAFGFSALTETTFYMLFAVGILLELSVPVVAERRNKTPWHRHHMIERYGLLNIIVLGETLLAGSIAIQHASAGHGGMQLVRIAIAALVIVFSMWWLYFSEEEHLENQNLSRALMWGYGHIVVFSSGAAVGAGIAVLVDIATGHAVASRMLGHYSIAIPVALYLGGLWLVRDRFVLSGSARHVLLGFAAVVLIAPMLPLGLEVIAGLTLLSVVVRSRLAGMSPVSR